MKKAIFIAMLLFSVSFAGINADTMMVCITPNFVPQGGSYSAPVQVALSCATANSAIYYTLENSMSAWQQYHSPVLIQQTDTLRSYSIAPGYGISSTITEIYNIQPVLADPKKKNIVYGSNTEPDVLFILNGQKYFRQTTPDIKKILFKSKMP